MDIHSDIKPMRSVAPIEPIIDEPHCSANAEAVIDCWNLARSITVSCHKTVHVQVDENSAASNNSECIISNKIEKKLEMFSKRQPITHPPSHIKGYPRVCTHPGPGKKI